MGIGPLHDAYERLSERERRRMTSAEREAWNRDLAMEATREIERQAAESGFEEDPSPIVAEQPAGASDSFVNQRARQLEPAFREGLGPLGEAVQFRPRSEQSPGFRGFMQGVATGFAPPVVASPELRAAIERVLTADQPAVIGGVMQGLSFGTADEQAALLGSLRGEGRTYEGELERIRAGERELRERAPWEYGLGEFAGTLPSAALPLGTAAQGASALARYARPAATMMGLTGLSGAAHSEAPTVEGRMIEATPGALGAGVLGLLPPGIADTVRGLRGTAQRATLPALGMTARDISRFRGTPEELARILDEMGIVSPTRSAGETLPVVQQEIARRQAQIEALSRQAPARVPDVPAAATSRPDLIPQNFSVTRESALDMTPEQWEGLTAELRRRATQARPGAPPPVDPLAETVVAPERANPIAGTVNQRPGPRPEVGTRAARPRVAARRGRPPAAPGTPPEAAPSPPPPAPPPLEEQPFRAAPEAPPAPPPQAPPPAPRWEVSDVPLDEIEQNYLRDVGSQVINDPNVTEDSARRIAVNDVARFLHNARQRRESMTRTHRIPQSEFQGFLDEISQRSGWDSQLPSETRRAYRQLYRVAQDTHGQALGRLGEALEQPGLREQVERTRRELHALHRARESTARSVPREAAEQPVPFWGRVLAGAGMMTGNFDRGAAAGLAATALRGRTAAAVRSGSRIAGDVLESTSNRETVGLTPALSEMATRSDQEATRPEDYNPEFIPDDEEEERLP